MIKKLLFLVPVAAAQAVFCQTVFTPAVNIPVTINGNTVSLPWAGGFNAPLFSEIDLDGDGIKDLFAFEKDGGRVSTFRNLGTANQVSYEYAPQYAKAFPKMRDWAILRDVNCDGKEDIVTSVPAGMKIYLNAFSMPQGLKFNLLDSLVKSLYGTITTNLYVSAVNLPAVEDMDGDGDVDVVTFAIIANLLEYHRNYAVENTGNCDTLIFKMDEDCWGQMSLDPDSNYAHLGLSCRKMNPGRLILPQNQMERALHNGSCMIAPDLNGDGSKDILNGDILGYGPDTISTRIDNMLFIEMSGSGTGAIGVSQDIFFPSYDVSVDLIRFPAPHYFDVNNDGYKDFIASPCIGNHASENFTNIWYYKNTTNNQTNVFSFQQDDFLVDQMIETGAMSKVRFFDASGDGLKDLLIGNYGYFDSIGTVFPFIAYQSSGISYYRNTGTATAPSFALVTRDYANLNQYLLRDISPAFGDMDGDGDMDMIIGEINGYLHYFENAAGAGQPADFTTISPVFFYDSIDAGVSSAPYIVDLNRDGKKDLVVGKKNGRLAYFQNTGGTNPIFTKLTDTLGGINVTKYPSIDGYSYPVFMDVNNDYKLYVGSESGWIYRYDNIDGNLAGTFNKTDSTFGNIHEPDNITLDIADIDNNGLYDIITGTFAGGATIYTQSFVSVSEMDIENLFNIFPNPADEQVTIRMNEEMRVPLSLSVYDVTGRTIYEKSNIKRLTNIKTSAFDNGLYLIVLSGDGIRLNRKIMISH